MVDRVIKYICIFLSLMVVLPLHEYAHAFVAVKSGDDTPKLNGRYTLNPFSHFDMAGLICFVFAGFGWAKPVPINPSNFRHYKRDCFFVSIAGVLANYATAFVAFPLFLLSIRIPQVGYFTLVLQQTLLYIISMGLCFFVFNLIPVYPLDGFRVLDLFNKKHGSVYKFLRNYGTYVLLAFMFLSVIADYTGVYQLDVLGIALNFIVGYIEIPISAFWGLFF